MKKILLTTLTVFALSAQADLISVDHEHNWNKSPSAVKSSGSSALSGACKDAISAATAENKKAKKVGFEWRDTAKFLKKAKKAGGKGCVKLANKAKAQALNAQQQAKDQANAGPVRF